MKRLILIGTILLALVAMFEPAPAEAGIDVNVGVSFFYDALAPYGDWVTVDTYGVAWCPRGVAVGWQPYLFGEWRYTKWGWTWVSFDPWGGDPYHYGTWVFAAGRGWVWIPGTIWAPAWVTWCWDGSNVGWAPVPPSLSIGLVGYTGPAVVAPVPSYVFVPARSFVGVDARTVRLDPARNASFVSGSRKLTHFDVSGGIVRTGGPSVSQIQKVTGASVRTVSPAEARVRPVPIEKAAAKAKALPVVVPERDRVALREKGGSRGGTEAPHTARDGGRGRKPEGGAAKPPAPKKVEPAQRHQPPRERAQPLARKSASPHVGKSEATVERRGPPHDVRAQAPVRKPEPRPETKLEPDDQRKEPPHDTKTQPAARPKEPPHEATIQSVVRKAEPPHQGKSQPVARKPQKPQEPETPDRKGG